MVQSWRHWSLFPLESWRVGNPPPRRAAALLPPRRGPPEGVTHRLGPAALTGPTDRSALTRAQGSAHPTTPRVMDDTGGRSGKTHRQERDHHPRPHPPPKRTPKATPRPSSLGGLQDLRGPTLHALDTPMEGPCPLAGACHTLNPRPRIPPREPRHLGACPRDASPPGLLLSFIPPSRPGGKASSLSPFGPLVPFPPRPSPPSPPAGPKGERGERGEKGGEGRGRTFGSPRPQRRGGFFRRVRSQNVPSARWRLSRASHAWGLTQA